MLGKLIDSDSVYVSEMDMLDPISTRIWQYTFCKIDRRITSGLTCYFFRKELNAR